MTPLQIAIVIGMVVCLVGFRRLYTLETELQDLKKKCRSCVTDTQIKDYMQRIEDDLRKHRNA